MSSTDIYTIPLSYVYKITNIETNEFYIGSRTCKEVRTIRTPEQDLLIHYYTSSPLKHQISESPEKFKGEILFRSNESILNPKTNKEESVSYWYEQLLIKENIKNPLCLNKHYIDPDNFNSKYIPDNESQKKSQEKIKFLKETTSYDEDRRNKIRKTISNRTQDEKEQYNNIQSKAISNWWLNNRDEIIQKRIQTQKNKSQEQLDKEKMKLIESIHNSNDKRSKSNSETFMRIKLTEPEKYNAWVNKCRETRDNWTDERRKQYSINCAKGKTKPVYIDGFVFPSMKKALEIFKIDRVTLSERIKSNNPKWSNWFFI